MAQISQNKFASVLLICVNPRNLRITVFPRQDSVLVPGASITLFD